MSTLRVSGGTLRGRKVALPRHEIRPTSGRAREAYFNVVAPIIAGARFLDLFAGSGIFSIEAASRGAARIVAVDQARSAIQPLTSLARDWNLPIETMQADALQAIPRLATASPFDLVWADPPYEYPRYGTLIEAIDARLSLAAGALIAIEHRSGDALPVSGALGRLSLHKTSRYGGVSITYLRNEA